MRIILLTLLLLSANLVPQIVVANEIIVVANTSGEALTLEKREVRNLFMGGVSREALKPVILPVNSKARITFNTKVIGLTESRIQSYWAQMRFSGRNKPPQQLDSADAIIQFLLENEGSVSYLLDDTEIPPALTIVYATK